MSFQYVSKNSRPARLIIEVAASARSTTAAWAAIHPDGDGLGVHRYEENNRRAGGILQKTCSANAGGQDENRDPLPLLAFRQPGVRLAKVSHFLPNQNPRKRPALKACRRLPSSPRTGSVGLTAGRSRPPHKAQRIAKLCQTYWHPLYAYVRPRASFAGGTRRILTQEFFSRLLAGNWVSDADLRRGVSVRFCSPRSSGFRQRTGSRPRAETRRRRRVVPLDTAKAESRYLRGYKDALTPDRLYDRQWALTLLDRALTRLETEISGGAKP